MHNAVSSFRWDSIRSSLPGRAASNRTPEILEASEIHQLWTDFAVRERAESTYAGDHDWVFASQLNRGRLPYWPDMILKRHIRSLAEKLGTRRSSWSTQSI